MRTLNFREFTSTKAEKLFGINETFNCEVLNHWLALEYEVSENQKWMLNFLKDELNFNISSWNESELSMNFIGPLFAFVNFSDFRFNLFSNRQISSIFNDLEVGGIPDGMIASGRREPELPIFCLQEYKRQIDPNGDPIGQLLAAMVISRNLNTDNQPVFGCYIIGKSWNFVVLNKDEYCISKSYITDDEEIFDVFRILQGLKQIIQKKFR